MNLKGVLFLLSCSIGLLIFLPIWWFIFLITTFIFRKTIHPSSVARPFFKSLYSLLQIKVDYHRPPNLDTGIILCNHQSMLDIGLVLAWIKPVSFLAKIELFKIPILNWALKFTKTLPVYRGQRDKNTRLELQLKNNIQIGTSYCVFPEGTRSNTQDILPFKTGIFRIAKNIQAPIHLFKIEYANNLNPNKSFKIYPGTIILTYINTINSQEYQEWDENTLKKRVASFYTLNS